MTFESKNVFVGGIVEGENIPFQSDLDPNKTLFDLGLMRDIVIVDRHYLFEHIDEIKKWSDNLDKLEKKK